MNPTGIKDRFFQSTRGRLVSLLRRDHHTVDELATELGLTANAIRTHLTALERDGLVIQEGLRRGASKPAFTYMLTPQAERLFPKAYGILLQQLLQVLGERLPQDVVADALREVGHRVAPGNTAAEKPVADRVEDARVMLGNLGGLAEVEETDTGYLITGLSCPLATAVEGHADACLIAETLLSDLTGVPVHQVCDPGPPARCRFEVLTMSNADPERKGEPMA